MNTIMEGLTIGEMAEKLKITPNTVKQRLFQRGIKPFCKDALYEPSALALISDFGPKGFQSGNKNPKTKVETVKAEPAKAEPKPRSKAKPTKKAKK